MAKACRVTSSAQHIPRRVLVLNLCRRNRLFGLVVEVSTSAASGSGFDSRFLLGVFFSGAIVCLSVGCLMSQQQASVTQGRICSDNFTCCRTEKEVADPTFCLTQSQYTDTGPTSPSADPITPGAWQGSHWSANS